jgi:Zn finger protein HypA/HybF involved in hydrogenase expression
VVKRQGRRKKCRKTVANAKGKFYMEHSFSPIKGVNMKIICPSCHYVGESKVIAKGSRKIEITLWCCFILPGMLYTMWRQSRDGQYQGCPQCHQAKVRLMKRKEWQAYERNGQLPPE